MLPHKLFDPDELSIESESGDDITFAIFIEKQEIPQESKTLWQNLEHLFNLIKYHIQYWNRACVIKQIYSSTFHTYDTYLRIERYLVFNYYWISSTTEHSWLTNLMSFSHSFVLYISLMVFLYNNNWNEHFWLNSEEEKFRFILEKASQTNFQIQNITRYIMIS